MKRFLLNPSILKTVFIFFTLFYVSISYGQKTWDGGAGTSNWGDANNWNPNGLPSNTDSVTLTAGQTVVVNTTTAVCASVQINNSNGNTTTSLTVNSGQTLTVGSSGTGTVTIGSGTAMSNGSISTTTLTVSGNLVCGNINQSPGNRTVGAGGDGRTNLTINSTGVVTATGNVAGTSINGTGTLTATASVIFSGAGVLNLTGAFTTSVFTPSTGRVNYNNAGAQSVRAAAHYNVSLSGSGTKTVPSATTITNNLLISGAVASLNAGTTYNISTLTLGSSGTNAGTWGSTTATTATYQNNTYFAATTGRVNVATYTSITPTVTPTVGSYTYTGVVQGPNAATNTGTGSSYTFSYVGVSGTTYGPSATRPTNAGNYTVTATVADSSDGFYRSANSSATSFAIAARTLTITANNANKVYGTTQSTPQSGSTAFGSTGLQNGETIGTVTLNYGSGALAATDAVGSTSTITPSAATGGTFTASNYSITYTPNSGTLTVTAASLTITANNANKVYGTTQTTPQSGSTAFGSTGLQNGETIGTVTMTYGSGALAATDAVGSTSTITPSAAVGGTFTASNYNITYTPNSGTLTVTAASLTITADSDSKTYGQTYTVGAGSTAFTSSGLQNGETIGSITTSSAGAVNTAAVGAYDIIPSAATGGTFTAGNYSITYTNGTLTVNAAALTVTADNTNKVYGTTQATPQSGSTAFGSTGLQNGETIGTVTLTYGSGALAATDAVGSTSTITPSAATGGTFTAGNYNITYTPNSGTLTVTAASLTITADNANKVYGTTQTTPQSGSTAFGSTGLQNGETIGTVTMTYGSGALAATDAVGSTSTITPSAAVGGTFTASNYNITYTPNSGTLTVTAASLTITADSDSKTYGQTYTVGAGSTAFTPTGLQNGETIGSITTSSTGAVNTAAVGAYDIIPSAATGGTFTAGNYSITYTNGTLTVNAAALTVTADDATKCFGATYSSTTNFTSSGLVLGESIGSVTLTSSGSSAGALPGTYSIVPSAATGGSFTASNYSITYTDGTLTVSSTNTWTGGTSTAWATGTNWSCGVAPDYVSDVTISTATFYPEISSDVIINSLTLDSGTTLKVNSNGLTVTDLIDNDGTLTVENNANLLQVNNVANTGSGSTIVKRNSSALKRLDYTLWSSPVTGQGLYAFSPLTFANRFYRYVTSTNFYNNSLGFNITGLNVDGVNGTDSNNVPFNTGQGYLIRMPWNHPTAATVWNGQFEGVPNNGNYGITIADSGSGFRYNLIGNPYPSPISAVSFVAANRQSGDERITGVLYFWRETNNTTANNAYCSWSPAGGGNGTFVTNSQPEVYDLNGVIQTGQGFIVEAESGASQVNFNNSMRVNNTAGQFFRTNLTPDSEPDTARIWLNVTNSTGLFCQTAFGYMSGATMSFDGGIDGRLINDGEIALYSTVGNESLVIQGRALPFDFNDVVPLGLRITNSGNYSISIDHVDGLFSQGQTIYLRDNLASTIHNLTTGAYNFNSDAGTFDTRFEVMYQLPLGVSPIFDANQVVVYQNEANDFVINTGNIVMSSVKVFDVRGRLLLHSKGINANQTTITAGQANQVLLVQITSQDGLVVTKKVIR